MFHVKHFGKIAVCANALLLRGGWYEAGIWRKRTSGVRFIIWQCILH
jgi:hypothetical protein